MSNVNVGRVVENIRANTTVYTAIVEVVVNAIEAIDAKEHLGGQVSIRAYRSAQLETDGSLPEIQSFEIEDNGVGFKEGYTHGAGIGIKNIQSRVASLRGNMEIRSQPGVGSTIDIEFDTHFLLKKTQ